MSAGCMLPSALLSNIMSFDPYEPPQTMAEEALFQGRETQWTTIIGFLHLLGALLGFFVTVRYPSLDPVTHLIVTALVISLAGMLVVGGIGLIRKNTWAIRLSNVYAIISLALKAFLILVVLVEPNSLPTRQTVILMNTISGIYPLFCLICLNHPRLRTFFLTQSLSPK